MKAIDEFALFRKAVVKSLRKSYGCVISSYFNNNEKYNVYYGGFHLLLPGALKVSKPDCLQAVGSSASDRGNGHAWVPRVESSLWLGWEPDTIKYDVVFQINKKGFVSEFEGLLEKYYKTDMESHLSIRPYFLPMFTKPIAEALEDKTLEMVFPVNRFKRIRAVAHLNLKEI